MNDSNKFSEEEKKILLDHDYDGIQEFDYPLPNWWTMTFVLTSLFGIPYMIYYLFLGGPTLRQESELELAKIKTVRTAYAVKMAKFDHQAYDKVIAEGAASKGKEVFIENCASCHKDGGEGDVGPNLTDAYWMHAKATPETIYEVVLNGREDKGMPVWGEDLTKDEILAVVFHVMSLTNTNVANGKEPQGKKVD
ncbi:MAG: c-type cytochrome [Halobacteriovoraceae bacterium]|jgi:cytochrome c oxidase cbb3-type subunit III|nr:c-type cytochrome [Halobacteriovoraceae bacterium]MBT5095043.1 c-type cytochrome [Halobacteriovoraceae bacterium]